MIATREAPSTSALFLVARVGAEQFAFPAGRVAEVLDEPAIEWIPLAPAGMLGQLFRHGRSVPAWDAGWAFGVARVAVAKAAIVVRDGPQPVALVVDDVLDLVRIAPADLRPVPAGVDEAGLLDGVRVSASGGLVNVVRMDALWAFVAAAGSTAGGVAP